MALKTLLNALRQFVKEEQAACVAQLLEVWEKPLKTKLINGESQHITAIKRVDRHYLIATLGKNESRFREGDMICLHLGDPLAARYLQRGRIEAEYDNEWLIRATMTDDTLAKLKQDCYADPDIIDLRAFYDQALNDIAASTIGKTIILPLLAHQLDSTIFEGNYDEAASYAESRGLNEQQVDAVGKGVAAQYLACIQGPPGTGKTKVIGIIAKLLVDEGQRVLLTSHTHTAINHALNTIAKEQVPMIKVGSLSCTKSLDKTIPTFENAAEWQEQPDTGYVIGATPFATCNHRLGQYQFDTVIFDEASQITLPLAIMAMRKAKRFVFVGDHKQLPPVILSTSVLNEHAIFSRLINNNKDTSVMLTQTYRLCRELSYWPSQQYYHGALVSAGVNRDRRFLLPQAPKQYQEILSANAPFIFIQSPNNNSRNVNLTEAKWVAAIIEQTIAAGLAPEEIGIVTPFRHHAKALKSLITTKKSLIIDTVERMQGQERELIIISLCATDPQYLSANAEFLFQAQRMNVAITRPRTKLILIGPFLPPAFENRSDNKNIVNNIQAYRSLIATGRLARLAGN